jgi:hypothetical protein
MIETATQAGMSACDTNVLAMGVPSMATRRKRVAKKTGSAIPAEATSVKKPRRKFNSVRVGAGESEVRLRFPEGVPLPTSITVGRHGKLFLGIPQGTRPAENEPGSLRFLATLEDRRAWLATLPESPEDTAEISEAAVEAEPAPEQWFRIVLSDEAMEAGGWEFFPDGWCAKLIATSTTPYAGTLRNIGGEASFDSDWVYVQLPYHYYVKMVDDDGRQTLKYLTDAAGIRQPAQDGSHWGYKAVECGMWIPAGLLKLITVEVAAEIFEAIQQVL